MTFISIIIPVYNAEEYIESSLRTITSQTFDDWEVILVDDGSTDHSPAICDDFARGDSRIKVIHQQNAGTSAARNAGIAAATGKYLTFMDNDDWWRYDDVLEKMNEKISDTNADVLCHINVDSNSDGSQFCEYGVPGLEKEIDSFSVDQKIKLLADRALLASAVWTKVVRRQFIIDNDIIFPVGMRNEDTDWSAKVISLCASMTWLDDSFYVYRRGHEYAQTSHRLTQSEVDDLQKIIQRHLDASTKLSKVRQQALFAFLAYPFVVWIGQAQALDLFNKVDGSSHRKQLLAQFPKVARVSGRKSVRYAYLMSRFTGLSIMARGLGVAFRKKYPHHVVQR
ncbi:glycosyltransferase family 2 protein [Arcanobacterium phocae]|uniref:glycosyltransferase family 2 protein n=1 Tax=Arcanobacterium phocae TaxID=131112 RepID=UPI001C0F083D|nr:glycosyltransferase family 2 protein [Arcanobacterium phocae]